MSSAVYSSDGRTDYDLTQCLFVCLYNVFLGLTCVLLFGELAASSINRADGWMESEI